MNKTMYGIRRKGDGYVLKYDHKLVKSEHGHHTGLHALVEDNRYVGCGDWLVDDINIAFDCLYHGSNYDYGSYSNPENYIHTDDYEVVSIETVIKVV